MVTDECPSYAERDLKELSRHGRAHQSHALPAFDHRISFFLSFSLSSRRRDHEVFKQAFEFGVIFSAAILSQRCCSPRRFSLPWQQGDVYMFTISDGHEGSFDRFHLNMLSVTSKDLGDAILIPAHASLPFWGSTNKRKLPGHNRH